jgi:hypothetical protein
MSEGWNKMQFAECQFQEECVDEDCEWREKEQDSINLNF